MKLDLSTSLIVHSGYNSCRTYLHHPWKYFKPMHKTGYQNWC